MTRRFDFALDHVYVLQPESEPCTRQSTSKQSLVQSRSC